MTTWKPPEYRRRTERVGTAIVVAAGTVLALGALGFCALLLVWYLNV
ncbi:hypothetical protein [Streptomyces sp. G-G2]|nr:hypothetical protein [Streptomyces sp. G-G2]MDJ0385898.1 hypothetical protein [Streptomyces sp. G-G2]